MTRRTIFRQSLLCGALLVSSTLNAVENRTSSSKKQDKDPKNMIWIISDQHRAFAMSHMGDGNVNTPYMDRLANEGVEFSNAYSGCPWSTPFRGSLLTSRYPNNAVYRTPQKLDPELPMVSDAFNDAGYTTAYFGKWHLNGYNNRHFVPRNERGRFDVWIAYENNNSQYNSWVHGHDLWGRNDTIADAEKLDGYETDVLFSKAMDFIKKRPKKDPFFLVISVQPPHDPHVAPEEFKSRHNPADVKLRRNVPPVERLESSARRSLAGYYAQIENLDFNIGELYKFLEENGLLENTNIAYFSDHGDCHGSHGYHRKSSPWQEAVRIPCIFRPAGIEVKEHKSKAMFNHVDISTTTLGLCGIPVPEWMSGTDFSNHIRGEQINEEEEPDAVLLQHIFPKNFQCLDRPWRGLVTKDGWKYVVVENQPIMLFDLNEDPYELNNMVFHPEQRKRRIMLSEKLQSMLDKVGDNFKVSY